MSDIRRVGLTTLEPPKANGPASRKVQKSVRICVHLPESNEDNCPEYNYKDELAAVKRKSKHSKNVENQNGLDPFGDMEDDSVRRIAIEMEEKYGNKKKRKGRKDDYADIGMGYDESDSFIDNTDGYDEIIPQNVTTLHGGFYINSGALEFKTDDEASSEGSSSESDASDKQGEDSPEKNKSRKRVLETSDEEEEETKNENEEESHDDKDKQPSSKNTMQQAIKKKLFSQEKIQVKKRRLIDPLKKTVKELLREKRQDLNMSTSSEIVVTETDTEGDGDGSEKDPLTENKKPMRITSVTDAIESVVKATIVGVDLCNDANARSNVDVQISENVTKTIVDPPSSLEGESSHESTHIEKMEIVKLPENLPGDVKEIVENIKQAAAKNKEGKVKFFTDEVNNMLLSLERKCRCLGKSSRVKIYEHLSPFVKCRKETLIRRAKALVLEEEEKKLAKLLVTMKKKIDVLMPALKQQYESDSKRILQKKFSHESVDNEEMKALRMPKRRFKWDDDNRKCIKEILHTKKRCLMLEGKQRDTYDEQILLFLKNKVQPLWPEGWMSLSSLRKICVPSPESRKTEEPSTSKPQSSNSVSITEPSPQLSITPITLNSVSSKILPIKNNNMTLEIITKSPSPVNDLVVCKVSPAAPVKLSLTPPPMVRLSSPSISSVVEVKEDNVKDDKFDAGSVIVVNKTVKEDVVVQPMEVVIEPAKSPDKKTVIEANHCQVIDLTEAETKRSKPGSKSKTRPQEGPTPPAVKYPKPTKDLMENYNSSCISSKEAFREDGKRKSSSKSKTRLPDDPVPLKLTKELVIPAASPPCDYLADISKMMKQHSELSVSHANFFPNSSGVDFAAAAAATSSNRNDGDDIEMVMANLKALQKLSSPIKTENNSTSSPVSVIAYNKSFSPKSNASAQSFPPRTEYNAKGDFTSSFQDEFQKQLLNSLTQLTSTSPASSNKTNYNRCS